MMALHWSTPYVALTEMARLVGGMLIRIILAMAVIAGLDWLWQRYSWKKQLRMTRQELKEERRQYEPAPEIRSKIRGIQQSMARRRMLQDVSEADVVLTNPTHVSVALKYNAGEMEAPLVLAKGADLLAQKIREVAKANGVPVVERPPLARALYAAVEVGQQIPESLFVAVAEVLAMVYRTQKHRTH
jgi:flagellar biosynthetic protein FlhB